MATARSQSARAPSRGRDERARHPDDASRAEEEDASDIFLSCPDLQALWKEREDRTRATMQALNPVLTKAVLPKNTDLTEEETAAIRIQACYRGHIGRKQYVQLLFKHFNQEEDKRRRHMLRQCEEGELLLENHRLEVEFEDNKCVRRNRLQRYESKVITIQRAWRNYKRRKGHEDRDSPGFSDDDDDDDDELDDDDDSIDDDDDDVGNIENSDVDSDVNGNCPFSSNSDLGSPSDQTKDLDNEKSQEKSAPSQKPDSSPSTTGDSRSDPVVMTAFGGSKKGISMLHDLGSSVELDDKACYETSPETPSRRRQGINRLSLAEELAAMEERVMDDPIEYDSQNEESDYYASSSCVTSPEGDVLSSDRVRKRPIVSLSRNVVGEKLASPDDVRTTEGSTPRIESYDQNKNTNDFNANASCLMEETELSEALAKLKTKLGTAYMDNETLSSSLHLGEDLPIANTNRARGEVTYGDPSHVTHSTTSSLPGKSVIRSEGMSLTHKQAVYGQDALLSAATAATTITTTSTCNRGTNTQTTVTNTPSNTTAPCRNLVAAGGPSPGKRPQGGSEGGEALRGGAGKEKGGVDPSLPVLDWDSLEKHLAKMEREEEQQQSAKQTQRNSRQEILRKLAMGNDEEAEGDIYGKGRDKLSARLQGGMNLQICFVNENLEESDEDEGSKVAALEAASNIPGPIIGNRDSRYLFSRECSAGSNGSGTSPKAPSVTFEDIEDFESKKAQLQEEARIAWAKAEPLAKLQMELERQQRKNSPTSDLLQVAGLGDLPIHLLGKRFQYKTLSRMSFSKLQIILNDLHSQVERLNEELVQCLLVRDSYKREQESRLIDIEDLNRWIRMNLQQNNNSTLIGKEPLGDEGRKQRHQYEALLRLLGNTLPASGKKCFCGVSRSSSVVSNRSASSPEPDTIGVRPPPLSPISPGSCRSESTVNSLTESHASSPEMTWVRQAIVRYWHN